MIPAYRKRTNIAGVTIFPLLALAVLGACAPLSLSVISLDGSGTDNLSIVARLSADAGHPLILRGIDGHPIATVRVPSALRNWSFVVAPGKHLLWVSSVPYGHPLFPQFIRCYAIDASLDAGAQYILRFDPADEQALLLRHGSTQAEATGRLVDKPLMLERNCRWQ